MKRGNKPSAALAEHHFVAICGSAEGVCAQEADRKPAAFPGKKALCLLCCSRWLLPGGLKEKNNLL